MKKIFIVILMICCFTSCKNKTEKVNFVTINGTDLMNPDNSKLFIKGTNLGNWINPEGYMFGFHKANSPRLINQMFCELVGPDFTAEFWRKFKDNYITKADINFIHSCGANTIRIPFNYRLFTDEDYMGLTSKQDGFIRIDQIINWCRELNMYVILDMHDAPGGQTGDNIDDSYGYPWLLESETSQKLFCEIWKNIANHYKNEPVVLGYELCNEPIATYFDNLDTLNTLLEPLYKKATASIREVDNNHIIILGAPQWNSNFEPLKDWTFDDKIMFTCHKYGGKASEEGIKNYIDFRDKSGLPMYMGEIGHGSMEWQETYAKILQSNNIGYTFWPYKKMGDECMRGIGTPNNWNVIINFEESDRSSFSKIRENRPNQSIARKAMTEFLDSCTYANSHSNEQYIKSLLLK